MSKSQLVHIIQQYHFIEGHFHLDLLNCKYGKRVEQLTYPSQYVGCITNFAFPQYFVNQDYLCTPENVWSTLRLRPKYAQTRAYASRQSFYSQACRRRRYSGYWWSRSGLQNWHTRVTLYITNGGFCFPGRMLYVPEQSFSREVFDVYRKTLLPSQDYYYYSWDTGLMNWN